MPKLRLNQLSFLTTLFYIFTVDPKLGAAQTVSHQSDERCPEGYFLHTDELCYPKVRKPCPFETKETTTTVAISSTTTFATTKLPVNFKKLECPEGSIMLQSKCRKIICTLGEYYRGTCLQAVCPQGLVWRGKKCLKPAYLTTIIEIDNVIVNEVIEKPFVVATVNKVVQHTYTTTTTSTTTSEKPVDTSVSLPLTTTATQKSHSSPMIATATSKYNATDHHQSSAVCCKVLTPRLCKLYGHKWLCFNRKYERCDINVCKAPVVYLKAPEIKYEPPLLVMPPNPKLDVCEGNSCDNNSGNVVDCSGCSSFLSETCSPHCYRYICPKNSCVYIDLYEYCSIYPGKDGCLPADGCLWKWCQA